ncbi:hypothetical protein NXS19_011953 [Fusarium pseudograminearum]|nr:hypothetical protein NXS19_011953 [Fusarium pseudograminearum]
MVWFASRRIKYIQYQTNSNGEGKTHAGKVDNEWPTAGLGCVQPAAGFSLDICPLVNSIRLAGHDAIALVWLVLRTDESWQMSG